MWTPNKGRWSTIGSMSEKPERVSYNWQETGTADVAKFVCSCGEVDDEGFGIESHGCGRPERERYTCDGCGRVWRARWKGMTFELDEP